VSRVVHLGPGNRAPAWVEAIDRACFGDAWGVLDEFEHIWAILPDAFARWRILPEVHEAELLRIGVAPEARRRGQGRVLLRHCQLELERMGVDVLHLEVRVSNAAARALYESEGWRYRGDRRAYYRDGETAALYSRGE
jgi:ribosomal-protein-alanine N-acetyltransferase